MHVIGQIAYKKGCLEIVIEHLKPGKIKNLLQRHLKKLLMYMTAIKTLLHCTQKEAQQYIKITIGEKIKEGKYKVLLMHVTTQIFIITFDFVFLFNYQP